MAVAHIRPQAEQGTGAYAAPAVAPAAAVAAAAVAPLCRPWTNFALALGQLIESASCCRYMVSKVHDSQKFNSIHSATNGKAKRL